MTLYDSSVLIDYLDGRDDAVAYIRDHHDERAVAPPLVLYEVYEKMLSGTNTGGNPVGIAAAAVYVSASTDGRNVTLRKAAAVTGLTKETIWRHASKLRNSG